MSQSTRSLAYSLHSFRYEAIQRYSFDRKGAAGVLRSLRQDHGAREARLLVSNHYWKQQGGLLGA